MKRIILFSLALLTISFCFGTDYSKIDNQSASVPATLKTAPEIATYLTKNLATPTEKVRAIYYWIAHNIKYDMTQIRTTDYSYTLNETSMLNDVLQKRKGVCQHYAILFNSLCQSAGIQSYLIPGYTLQNGVIANLSHAWNAVYINKKYYEIDVTWAAGYIENGKFTAHFDDKYFLIPPAEFIHTHIPFDPVWQFLDNPVTHSEFKTADFSRLKTKSDFNFADSINFNAENDTLSNLIRENKRIQKSGLTNKLIRDYVSQNQQNIVQLKYNMAVKTLNEGIESYNLYVLGKNKQFSGEGWEDEDILELLNTARTNIETAEDKIRFLNGDNRLLLENIQKLQDEINMLKTNLDNEDKFVKKYISTARPFRKFLFINLK